MKSYNEMANDIFRRRDEYEAEAKKRKRKIIYTVTPLSLACLAVLAAVGVWQSDSFRSAPDTTLEDSLYPGEKDYISPDELESESAPSSTESSAENTVSVNSSTVSEPTPSGSGNDVNHRIFLLNINKIGGKVSAAKRYFDPEKHYTESWDSKKVAEYLGVDLCALEGKKNALSNNILPAGVSLEPPWNTTATYETGGKLVYDLFSVRYSGGGTEFTVKASRLGTPYDCLYSLENEVKTLIGDQKTEALVASDISFENMPLQYDTLRGFFVADFQKDGIYYRAEAENATAFEFEQLLHGLAE